MKSLDTIMQDLREGFSGLSEEEKAATASALGGQEAMSGLLAIVGASPEEYEKLQSAIENCDGTAERMAETMLDNLQGSLTILKSSLEGLGIEVYESMQEPLKNAADNGIADVTDSQRLLSRADLTLLLKRQETYWQGLLRRWHNRLQR